MFKYRDHRGGLAESMATAQEFDSKESLLNYLDANYGEYSNNIDISKITIKPYKFDPRIGWDSHIVHLEGYGVFGFTDQQI
jgi:hypothetical protein